MTKLEQLIKDLCTEGVKEYRVVDVADTFIGLATSVTKYKADSGVQLLHNSDISEGKINVKTLEYIKDEFAQKNSKKLLRTNDIITVHTGDVGTSAIITEEFDGCIGFTTISSRVKDTGFLIPGYLCVFLNSNLCKEQIASKTISDRNNLNLSSFDEILIPIPHIEIQREIVSIINKFAELTAELTVELTARKKQYEYYRDHLLAFNTPAIKILTIEEIFTIKGGYTPSKNNAEFWENGDIPWFRVEDINTNGRVLTDAIQHVTKAAVKKSGLFKENSIIITTSATIGEYALIRVPFLCNQRFTCLTLKDEYKDLILPEFLLHYCYKLSEFCKSHLNVGNFASVDMAQFNKFRIPIPSIETQERLISILDNFDAICTDLNIGLPAEIEARQKQYEYYRDKLLTFKEKEA